MTAPIVKKVSEFSNDSVLSTPGSFFTEALEDLNKSWGLAFTFFIRDLKAQYRLSFLGFFWSIIPPLMFVIGFSAASRANVINFGETPIPYPAFIMISIMIWQVFQECIEAPILGFKEAKPLVGRLKFSVESVFLSRVYMMFFNIFIKSLLVAAALIYFDVSLNWSAAMFIFPFVSMMCFGLFIGVVLAPLTFLIDDLSHGMRFFMTFWMLCTPVAYMVDQSDEVYKYIVWNPAASLISKVREVILSLPSSYDSTFIIVSIVGLIGLFFAWIFAKISLPFITERMGTV